MITKKILKALAATALTTVAILEIILEDSNPRHEHAKLFHAGYVPPHRRKRERDSFAQELSERKTRSVRVIISRLKKDGLIKASDDKQRKGLWRITQLGKKKLAKLNQSLGIFTKKYTAQPTNTLIIITFDIPEKLAGLRKWLRFCLLDMGFTKLQKSVWQGKVKIPEDFIEDINKFKLGEHIHIFEVTKYGTLDRKN